MWISTEAGQKDDPLLTAPLPSLSLLLGFMSTRPMQTFLGQTTKHNLLSFFTPTLPHSSHPLLLRLHSYSRPLTLSLSPILALPC